MTRRLTRASSRTSDILATNSNPENSRRLRPRKTKIIIDISDDEYFEEYSEKISQTPRKNKLVLDDAVTPPKQKKIDTVVTPKHNNVATCQTPSDLLNRLSLSSPLGNKTTHNRKSLFQESNDFISKNKIETINQKTNTLNKGDENYNDKLDVDKDLVNESFKKKNTESENLIKINSYRNARKALHSALPNSLPGREIELCELRNFIKSHIEKNTSGSMYVSGPPGTGKTASLSIILQEKYVSAISVLFNMLTHST